MASDRDVRPDESAEEAPVDLRRYLFVMNERAWWIMGALAFSLIVTFLYSRSRAPLYDTRATLLVDTVLRRRSSSRDDILETLTGLGRTRTILTQIEIIKSPSRVKAAAYQVAAQQILNSLGGEYDLRFENVPAASDPDGPRSAGPCVEVPREAVDAFGLLLRKLPAEVSRAEVEALIAGYSQPDSDTWGGYPPDLVEIESKAGLNAETGTGRQLRLAAQEWVPEVAKECRRLATRISVSGVRDTDVVAISCRSTVPELAAAYADAMAQEHARRSLMSNREVAQQGIAFIDEQLKDARTDLDGKELALRTLLEQNDLFSVSDTAASLVGRVERLTSAVTETTAAVRAGRAEVASLQAQLADQEDVVVSSSTAIPDPKIAELRSKLRDLEEERAGLLEKVTEEHSSIAELDGRIRRIRAEVEADVNRLVFTETRIRNPLGQELLGRLTQAQVKLEADDSRLAVERDVLARAQAELARIPEIEQRAAAVQRDVQIAEQSYTGLLERRQLLALAEAAKVPGASILDRAAVPKNPVSPNMRLNLIVALVLGLVGGLALAFAVDYLDNTVKSIAELERLFGIPVLTVVPKLRRHEEAILGGEGERHDLRESFRSLSTNLRYAAPEGALECLLITSPGSGEGKTTVTVNLGIVSGELGKQVAVVDGDLRRPAIASSMDVPTDVGLTNCVVGEQPLASALQESASENVKVLPSGPVPPNPTLILESAQMRQIVGELRETSDLVVIDSPPAAMLADAQILAALADGVVLVIEQGRTRRPVIRRALDILKRTGTPCLGVVMNKAVARRDYYYYYYYGDYYHDSREEAPPAAEE